MPRLQPSCKPDTVKVEQDVVKIESAEPKVKAEAGNVSAEPVLKAEAVDISPATSQQLVEASPFPDILRPLPHECIVRCCSFCCGETIFLS